MSKGLSNAKKIDYKYVILCGILMAVVAITMQFIISKAHSYRKEVLAQPKAEA